YPTAHISPGATAATAMKMDCVPRSGLLTTLQALPFQCSTRVVNELRPPEEPTARTLLLESTDTLKRVLYPLPVSAPGMTLQLTPSQWRIRPCQWLPVFWNWPTAHISLADTASTL